MALEPIIPKRLQKGDTIAFISPSARLNLLLPVPFERAKTFVEGLGYHVKAIFNSRDPANFQESVLQRCEEVHKAFRDTSIKAIVCNIGGSHVNELLSHLDYQLIKSHPKIFCGYSDITLLHYAILSQTGLQTSMGPRLFRTLQMYQNRSNSPLIIFYMCYKTQLGKQSAMCPDH